ncbi:MAG: hypothetical protein ACO1QB_04830 [Verrucomicrobiales bacterium]
MPSAEAAITINDPKDIGDSSGDIRTVNAEVIGDNLLLSMTVDGVAGPSLEQTPEGMVNRYHYHWLFDTDNNPATGRSNSEYEGESTGLTKPIGAERIVMVGWRDGKPGGLEVYDSLDDENPIYLNFPFHASGNTLTAILPLSALGLVKGQTVAISAFQEGASEDWTIDWVESAVMDVEGPNIGSGIVTDPVDDLGDANGDIRQFGAHAIGDQLFLWMTLEGIPGPMVEQTAEGMVNRYHWHWLLDTDNNPATGRSNAEYEGNSTGLTRPIGTERVVLISWRDGKPGSLGMYDPLDEENPILTHLSFQASGNMLSTMIPLSAVGLTRGQTFGLSAFQEGASEDWSIDWAESAEITVEGPNPPVAIVADEADLGDSNGDIRQISAFVQGENLHLSMTVQGFAGPAIAETAEGKVNRHYYHWLIDADNNPATGRSNAEYEGTTTGLSRPVGSEWVIAVGWRNGKPNGIELYNALDEENPVMVNFPVQVSGNTLTTVLPLSLLELASGQTVAISAFQEGASDDWSIDWVESDELVLDAGDNSGAPVAFVDDPQDIGDLNGDIKRIEGTVDGNSLVLRMSAYGNILPTMEQTAEGKVNRHYYHWLIDTDNNPATGRSNAEYEGVPTGLTKPVGSELVVALGWRNGALESTEVYNALEENPFVTEYDYTLENGILEVRLPLSTLGLTKGQTIALSAFQEGASDDWTVDWVESTVMTVTDEPPPTLSVEAVFVGDAYGFEIVLTDAGANVVDVTSVQVTLDGNPVQAEVVKPNGQGTTRITGKHGSLLAADSTHTIGLSVKVAGVQQSRNFVFKVEPYTVLPAAGRLQTIDTTKTGFVVFNTMIGTAQIFDGGASVHSNLAERAEMQLRGEMIAEGSETPYYNEADFSGGAAGWKGEAIIHEGVINWLDQAPGINTPINFPEDQPLPGLEGYPIEGLVNETLTYLHLPAGNHKLGVYTEGGHKITAGLSPTGPVLSLVDNSEQIDRVPSYFARNQFFDVVALEEGYYPIRIVWFQERRRQEPGILLEFFSVKDRALHLVNDTEDPLAIRAYRAGSLLTPGVEQPTLSATRTANGLSITYTGKLEATDSLQGGTWSVIGEAGESPMTIPATGTARFFRTRQDP